MGNSTQNVEEPIFCVSELDGFLTTVVSGPVVIPASQWLEAIWGDQKDSPEWQSEGAFQHIFGLLTRLKSSIAATLVEAPRKFQACFMERTVEGKHYTIVDEWCEGYIKGVRYVRSAGTTYPTHGTTT